MNSEEANTLENVQRDYEGRKYQDFYKVILMDSKLTTESQLINLRKAFTNYATSVNAPLQRTANKQKILGFNSSAAQGNLLEAVNLALDDLLLVI